MAISKKVSKKKVSKATGGWVQTRRNSATVAWKHSSGARLVASWRATDDDMDDIEFDWSRPAPGYPRGVSFTLAVNATRSLAELETKALAFGSRLLALKPEKVAALSDEHGSRGWLKLYGGA
jgi:hypothetical protein